MRSLGEARNNRPAALPITSPIATLDMVPWQLLGCDPVTNGALVIIRGERVGTIDNIKIYRLPSDAGLPQEARVPTAPGGTLGRVHVPARHRGTPGGRDNAASFLGALGQRAVVQLRYLALCPDQRRSHRTSGEWPHVEGGDGSHGATEGCELGPREKDLPQGPCNSLDLKQRYHGRADALLIGGRGHLHGSTSDDELKARVRCE